MASETRKKKTGILVWIIMGLLVLGLGGFGLTGAFQTTGATKIATVGDQEVTADRFIIGLQQDLRRASQQLNQNITLDQARLLGIDQTSLRRQITLAALANESDRLSLSVGNASVRDALLANPAFQVSEGIFSEATYDLVLRQQNMTRPEFEDLLRSDETLKLVNTAISGGIGPQGTAARILMDFIGETRNLSYATIDESVLTTPTPPPDEPAIIAYYDANPDAFTTPEIRKITYAQLTPEIVANSIDIPESDIQAYYDAQSAQFNSPAQRIVDRLVFTNIEDATTSRQRLDAGTATFQDIADEFNQPLHQVQLGAVRATQLSEPAAAEIFGTDEPGLFGPLESADGPALYRVNATMAAQNVPLDDARDAIRASLSSEQAKTRMQTDIGNIDDLIAGGASIEDLAKETDMQLGSIDYSVQATDPITADAAFATEALAAEVGQERDLVELANGGIFALRVDKIIPARLLPLSEARDQAIAGATAAATIARVQAYTEELKAQIDAGADLTATVSALGLKAINDPNASRTSPPTDLPPLIGQDVFNQDQGAAISYPVAEGAIIVQVNSITPFDPESADGKSFLAQAESQMKTDIGDDLYAMYANGIVGLTDVTVNQGLIDQILAGGGGVSDGHPELGH